MQLGRPFVVLSVALALAGCASPFGRPGADMALDARTGAVSEPRTTARTETTEPATRSSLLAFLQPARASTVASQVERIIPLQTPAFDEKDYTLATAGGFTPRGSKERLAITERRF